ncbi:hypothetical protein [Sphingomonas oryzagri]
MDPDRESVPSDIHAALIRWYVGQGDYDDERTAVHLVQRAKMFDRWIACDCLGSTVRPPLLSPAYLTEAQTYYLRRLTGDERPEHQIDCPFYRDQAAYLREKHVHDAKPLAPPDGFFSALKPLGEHLAQQPIDDADDNRVRGRSTPRLARLLWKLIELGRTNIVEAIGHRPKPSITIEFAALREAARDLWIAPAKPLASFLFTHPDMLRSRRIYAKLREAAETWPDGHEPHAFLILYAANITKREIQLADGEPITVTSDIIRPTLKMIDRGPWLVILAIGHHSQARGYAPVRAYAQPIQNGRQFVPVDSNAERAFLAQLLDLQWSLNADRVDFRIKKAVFDLETDLGPCRPDFMLDILDRRTGVRRLQNIELLGYETDSYQRAKAVTIPRMETIAPVAEYAIGDLDDHAALRASLTRLIRG